MKNQEKIAKLENEIDSFLKTHVETGDNLISKFNELYELYCENNDLESIKRALFLQWYAVSEPQLLTGLPDFNEVLQRNNLNKVEQLLLNQEVDQELLLMMKHYIEVSDWYFNEYSFHKLLSKYKLDSNSIKTPEKRGYMGRYWSSF